MDNKGYPTRYLVMATVDIAKQLGFTPGKDICMRIADVIADGAQDLVRMPPMPKEVREAAKPGTGGHVGDSRRRSRRPRGARGRSLMDEIGQPYVQADSAAGAHAASKRARQAKRTKGKLDSTGVPRVARPAHGLVSRGARSPERQPLPDGRRRGLLRRPAVDEDDAPNCSRATRRRWCSTRSSPR
jgi:hypothetical protein